MKDLDEWDLSVFYVGFMWQSRSIRRIGEI